MWILNRIEDNQMEKEKGKSFSLNVALTLLFVFFFPRTPFLTHRANSPLKEVRPWDLE